TALLLRVRVKGVAVERDDPCTRRLRAPYAFDRRMQTREWPTLAADEANSFQSAAFGCDVLPDCARGRDVVQIGWCAADPKDDVAVLHLFGESSRHELLRRPAVKKGEQRLQIRIVGSGQQFTMELLEVVVLLCRPLSTPAGDAQHVRGLIPQETGCDAGGADRRLRHAEKTRSRLSTFLLHQRYHRLQRARRV